uniref:AMP-dependent synthetase/ligase domain-containing protein n=1 Tax=Chromera velia CCMP2878 TaxID=1169474 RepID=A0A0G4I6V9_9ALVE|eukprot:Cvel_1906.t1-p1 / transcript=Cvel_1906.t1 / gene=Cvel_1906 / organism=Chromera_velia_CCMP2878 / gene_product=Nonribosomal peptide syntethase 9, putative / transcript_product=Nonribosomal peptide syntethase 9, putative / location=Cvel_scaffold71:90916-94740(-) / protein_length=1275 / sequence_SO=supercontig / SO=protein_coding / is_pseudo=false
MSSTPSEETASLSPSGPLSLSDSICWCNLFGLHREDSCLLKVVDPYPSHPHRRAEVESSNHILLAGQQSHRVFELKLKETLLLLHEISQQIAGALRRREAEDAKPRDRARDWSALSEKEDHEERSSIPPSLSVGVLLSEGPLLLLTVAAILLTPRAVLVPLSPTDPLNRLRSAVNASKCQLIIGPSKAASLVSALSSGPPVVSFLSDEEIFGTTDVAQLFSRAAQKARTTPESPPGQLKQKCSASPSGPHNAGKSLSHIYFTSGSTGDPKGCLVSKTSLLHFASARNAAHEFRQGDTTFIASTFTFDPYLGDLVSSWLGGGCVAVPFRQHSVFDGTLLGCVNLTGATHMCTTPAVLATAPLPSPKPNCLPPPSLRVLAVGGERMSASLATSWLASVPVLLNTWGTTECCVYQTVQRVLKEGDRRLIGEPLGSTRLHVMGPLEVLGHSDVTSSDVRELTEEGAVGELWVGGPQVGLGYCQQQGKEESEQPGSGSRSVNSRSAFVNHPTLGWIFRTGDLVRKGGIGKVGCGSAGGGQCMRESGSLRRSQLSLVGRTDSQVKIKGRRVDLQDIEASLSSVLCPLLFRQIAATLGPSGAVCAVFSPCPFPSPLKSHQIDSESPAAVRILCATAAAEALLPVHMRPLEWQEFFEDETAVTETEGTGPERQTRCVSLPLTKSGKIDRRRLASFVRACQTAEPQGSSRTRAALLQGSFSSSLSPLKSHAERKTATAWEEVLKLGNLSRTSHFLRLGGDSILAVRVCRMLTESIQETIEKGEKERKGGEGGVSFSSSSGAGGGTAPRFAVGVEGLAVLPGDLMGSPVLSEFAKKFVEPLLSSRGGEEVCLERRDEKEGQDGRLASRESDTRGLNERDQEEEGGEAEEEEGDMGFQRGGMAAETVVAADWLLQEACASDDARSVVWSLLFEPTRSVLSPPDEMFLREGDEKNKGGQDEKGFTGQVSRRREKGKGKEGQQDGRERKFKESSVGFVNRTVLQRAVLRAASCGSLSALNVLCGKVPLKSDDSDAAVDREEGRGESRKEAWEIPPFFRLQTLIQGFPEGSLEGEWATVYEALVGREGGRVALQTAKDPQGGSVLHCAARTGRPEIVSGVLSLLEGDSRGGFSSVLSRDQNGQTALHWAARAGGGKRVVSLLLDPASFEGDGGEGKRSSKKGGGSARAEREKQRLSVLESRDVWARTALHWAALNGHRDAVAALLAEGAATNVTDEEGETPFSMAERRALCAQGQLRPDGMGASVFGDILKLLGGRGTTKKLSAALGEG